MIKIYRRASFKQIIRQISIMVEEGIHYSTEKVGKHVDNEDIINWLEETYEDNNEFTFKNLNDTDRKEIHQTIKYIWNLDKKEHYKDLVRDNGLMLLIIYTSEMIEAI